MDRGRGAPYRGRGGRGRGGPYRGGSANGGRGHSRAHPYAPSRPHPPAKDLAPRGLAPHHHKQQQQPTQSIPPAHSAQQPQPQQQKPAPPAAAPTPAPPPPTTTAAVCAGPRSAAAQTAKAMRQAYQTNIHTCFMAMQMLVKDRGLPDWHRNVAQLQDSLDNKAFMVSADAKTRALNPHQKLLFLMACCKFYQDQSKSKTLETSQRYALFDMLFLGRADTNPIHEYRIEVLSKVCSLALQYPAFELFDDVATWWMKCSPTDDHPQRMIRTLVEDFIKPAPVYRVFEPLLPLREKALEFACFFLAHGFDQTTVGPQAVAVIGHWLAEDQQDVVDFFAEHKALGQKFGQQTLPVLLAYDVRECRGAAEEEEQARFHCALTGTLVFWCQRSVPLRLDVLLDLVQEADGLDAAQQRRLLRHVRNALHVGMFPTAAFARRFAALAHAPRLLRRPPLADLLDADPDAED